MARKSTKTNKKDTAASAESNTGRAKFPRHSLGKALRIPGAILEQNAGKPCTTKEAAAFVGVGDTGPFRVEVGSGIKYGLLERPQTGTIQPSNLAKKILRPQSPNDALEGYREALLNAPDLSDIYKHYRGENLPDDQFLKNTVVEKFNIPEENFQEFKQIFLESLETAQLLSKHGDKFRIIDITSSNPTDAPRSDELKKLVKGVSVAATDTCFVMQPFAPPLGDYYDKIYKPAIEKAGLRPIRADTDIFILAR